MAGFYPYRKDGFGGAVTTFKGKAPATTAIAVGDPLTVDSDGYYALMASAGQCDGVSACAIASGDAGQPMEIWRADETFKVATGTTAPALTDVSELLDISVATTGAFVVDPASSSNDDFYCEGIVEKRPDNKGVTLAIGDEVYGHFVDTCYNV